VVVEDIATTAKTLPQFVELWASMLGQIQSDTTQGDKAQNDQRQVEA
jgi:hypothetical protein